MHPQLQVRRRSLFWRIHFWSAVIASPFALLATLTGILYIFTPQIEQALYGHLERVAPGASILPLDRLVAAAQSAAPPGMVVHSVVPPYAASDVFKVTMTPVERGGSAHEGHHHAPAKAAPQPAFGVPAASIVKYVNPYTGAVMGSMAAEERFGEWAKKLHSSLLQSDNWRWMIELAASWLMVMLITGVWLWWPRAGARLLPSATARGRKAWSQWHAFLGVVLCVVSLAILTTGLTWSMYSGAQIRALRDAAGQASPKPPRQIRSVVREGRRPLDWQAAWDMALSQTPDVALQLTPPRGEIGVWKVGAADRGQPTKRFDLLLDAYSGEALYYSGWRQQTAFGKATAVGIPFHRGEFGWWNQAVLLIFGLGILFSLLSGWVMYFQRRKPGSLGLPPMPVQAWRAVSPVSWVVTALLCALMPLLALSGGLLLLLECALYGARRRAV